MLLSYRTQKVYGRENGKKKLSICLWQQPQKDSVFSMHSDNHHEWTKTQFRLKSLYPDYQDCVQIHFRWPVECISNVSPVTNDEILFPCSHVILSVGTLAAAKQKKKSWKKRWLFAISNRILRDMFSELTGMGKSAVLKLFHAICTLYYTVF